MTLKSIGGELLPFATHTARIPRWQVSAVDESHNTPLSLTVSPLELFVRLVT